MKKYQIEVSFTFTGTFTVKAETQDQAEEFIEKHVGLALGQHIHTTLPEYQIEWNFPMHPEKEILEVECEEEEGEDWFEKPNADTLLESATIQDTKNGYQVTFGSDILGECEDFETALADIRERSNQQQFYPSIYHINDHGNINLINEDGDEIYSWV